MPELNLDDIKHMLDEGQTIPLSTVQAMAEELTDWRAHACPKFVSTLPWIQAGVSREQWIASFVPGMFGGKSASWSLLELASADGKITKELSSRPNVSRILCVEGRLENIAKARELSYQCEVVFEHKDFEDSVAWKSVLQKSADLLVHCGLLYHLTEPLSHLREVQAVAPRLLLDTHYARGGSLERHGEHEHPRAGMRAYSYWLPKRMILATIREFYSSVVVLNDRQEKNGPRITIAASR